MNGSWRWWATTLSHRQSGVVGRQNDEWGTLAFANNDKSYALDCTVICPGLCMMDSMIYKQPFSGAFS